MSLGSTVLSFYPITYGFIQDMAPLKQASEGIFSISYAT